MAKFSGKAKNTTFESAPAQLKSLDQEWANALCSSFLGDTFMRQLRLRQRVTLS